MKLNSIGVWSMAKIQGAVALVIGLIFGVLYGLIMIVAGAIAMSQGGEEGLLVMGLGLGIAIAAPFLYGLMGLVGGAFLAIVYNIGAKLVGGLELDLRD